MKRPNVQLMFFLVVYLLLHLLLYNDTHKAEHTLFHVSVAVVETFTGT